MLTGMPKTLMVLFLIPFALLLAKTAVVGLLMVDPVSRPAVSAGETATATPVAGGGGQSGEGPVKGPF